MSTAIVAAENTYTVTNALIHELNTYTHIEANKQKELRPETPCTLHTLVFQLYSYI